MSHLISGLIGFITALLVMAYPAGSSDELIFSGSNVADVNPNAVLTYDGDLEGFSFEDPTVWLKMSTVDMGSDRCVMDVEIWPSKWEPTNSWEQGCSFGQVIVY